MTIIKSWDVPRGKRYLIVCDFCRRTFERMGARIRRYNSPTHFCDLECKANFQKGKKPWNKGKIGLQHHSKESREKIRMAQIKIKDHKGRFKEGHVPWSTGKKHSEETKQKISVSRRGKSKGQENYNWKGGRINSSNGYVLVKMPNHPYCDKRGYVYEHRLMAGKALGRHLKSSESVHHINNKHGDNRNNNFVICTESYHQSIFHKNK